MTCDMWQVTHGGGEYSLKISALQLLRFGMDSFLKILNKSMIDWINCLISHKGVYKTAPATPGLFITPIEDWFESNISSSISEMPASWFDLQYKTHIFTANKYTYIFMM